MKLQAQYQKAKKLYLSGELLGVEKRISPTQVGKNHASCLKNFLLEDGANRKRRGWREIYHFTDENDKNLRINGIFEYKEKEIIHAGEYLYKGDTRIGSLADKKSCGFENNGFLYIVCDGELFIYNGSELINAYDSIYSYAPLTTTGIMPIGSEVQGVKKEEPSLLTPKRINSLIGDRAERKSYRLDGKIDINKPLEVRTKMLTSFGSTEPNKAPYNAIYKYASRLTEENIEGVLGIDRDVVFDIFAGNGTDFYLSVVDEVSVFLKTPVKIESASFEAREGTVVPKMSFHLGNELIYETDEGNSSECDLTDTLYGQTIDAINFYGSDGAELYGANIQCRAGYHGEVEIVHSVDKVAYNRSIRATSIKDTNGRELTFSNNITGSYNQGAVICVEKGIYDEDILAFDFCNVSPSLNESNIEVTYSVLDSERLTCHIGDVCKTNTGSAILALSDYNYVYMSCGARGFGYFPYSLKRKIGTDEKITAVCNMSEASVGVFKRDSAYYLEAEVKGDKTEVTLKTHSTQGGSLSHFATKTVNLDTLSPQNDNIYGSLGMGGRVRRGSNIALDLKDLRLENSVAVSHNGCYYLFVDGCAYVADTRYKIYENNRLDSSFEYEWWYLDNIPASYVAKINNLIYIGRDDGRIVSFYDGFCDMYYEKIHTGSFLLDKNDEGNTILYLNEELGLHTCDKILVSSAFSYVGGILSCELWNGHLKLFLKQNDFWASDSLRVYPNDTIYLHSKNGGLTEAIVEDIDVNECSLMLNLREFCDTYTDILCKNDRTGYKLEQQDGHFMLVDAFGDYARLYFTDEISLVCEKKLPVVCEYVTSAILSDSHTVKSFCGICVELLGDSCGVCEISYETDKSQNEKAYALNSPFDFDRLDFSSASFNSSLQKRCALRCFERGIDYIIIKIKHSEDKPFSLKSYLAIYNERSLNG